MTFRLNCIAALCAALPVAALAQDGKTLGTVTVTEPRMVSPGETAIGEATLAPMRAATSDTARLLLDIPGVSLYGAGGVSSLPAIRGLADDRLRIQVDGMDLMAACPNHMNSALSYIDPSRVAAITVFAGITPVSVGGDSIGGTIQVKSAPPRFADNAEQSQASGQVGAFYRSNGNASGFNLGAEYVAPNLYLNYNGSLARSDNYSAGGDFKPAGPGTVGGPWLTGSEVGSSAYNARNHDIGLAWRQDQHLLQLNVSQQNIPFEGFPNQRMDMTANDSTQVNLRYTGKYQWGQLMVRGYDQNTDHEMNMGPDRFSYGTQGMPMNTQARTRGGLVQADVALTELDIARVGLEGQTYTLYDWWPPVGGVMGPNTFWNIDYGTRNRAGAFGEWERQWNEQWLSQIGVRGEVVKTDAGPVQGYNAQPIWSVDAAAFNAAYRPRTDHNVDFTALTRYTPDAMRLFEAGFARKSRSPNLYQRYLWSTQPMAMLMNNFVGDGNGYVGNLDLRPEVAHTVSASGDWHDAAQSDWRFKATAFYTYVQDYIDARRCNFGQCGGQANLDATTGFVNLQYVNQSARLYGFDMAGNLQLGQSGDFGSFKGSGLLSYVRGKNTTTGDNLYNIMPLNAKVAVTQTLGGWSNTAEVQLVGAKTNVSQVRNEVPTAGYGLLNLRSSYEWKQFRLDFGIENVLNRFYTLPLGGAYLGQGASMTSKGIPWGVVVPGMGRSFNLALTVRNLTRAADASNHLQSDRKVSMFIRHSMFLAGSVLSSLLVFLSGCGGGDGPAIKAIPQTIQFGPPPTLALNGTATVTATASSGLPVSFSTLTPEVCTVNGSTGLVNNLKAGTCLIAADQPGNNDFAPAPQATQSLVVAVNPAQSIRWAPPPTLALFGQVVVSATASSGLPVTYSSKTPALCTVHSVSGLVTSLTSGDCTIAADQAGDSQFNPAPQVLQVLPVAAWSGPLTAPGSPTDVAATLGAGADSAVVRFVGPASSGGSPITGYTVVSVPAGFSASGAASPIAVNCPSGCAGRAFAVVASNAIGNSAPSAAADVLTRFDVTATFFEPDTQPNDTIFTGSFTVNSTKQTVSDLAGALTQSMTGPPMTTVPLVYQLSSVSDGQGGLLVSGFALNTTNVFAGGGFPTGSEGLYYGWPTAPNPGAPGGVGNSYVTIYVNPANPLAPLTKPQVNKLVYGDCAAGGMMGDTCMTGYVGWGTMGGYPVTQTINRQ